MAGGCRGSDRGARSTISINRAEHLKAARQSSVGDPSELSGVSPIVPEFDPNQLIVKSSAGFLAVSAGST